MFTDVDRYRPEITVNIAPCVMIDGFVARFNFVAENSRDFLRTELRSWNLTLDIVDRVRGTMQPTRSI